MLPCFGSNVLSGQLLEALGQSVFNLNVHGSGNRFEGSCQHSHQCGFLSHVHGRTAVREWLMISELSAFTAGPICGAALPTPSLGGKVFGVLNELSGV